MSTAQATLRRIQLDLRQQLLLALALMATLAIPMATPFSMPGSTPTAAGDNQCYPFSAADKAFAQKMNSERKAKGLGTMKLDPELSKAAKVHTNEMAKTATLAHSTTTQLTRRVTNWVTLGENVGVGAAVDTLHTAFMNSPAHRSNIMLAKYKNVGVATKTADGRLWVTVIFEAQNNPGTSLAMPRC